MDLYVRIMFAGFMLLFGAMVTILAVRRHRLEMREITIDQARNDAVTFSAEIFSDDFLVGYVRNLHNLNNARYVADYIKVFIAELAKRGRAPVGLRNLAQ